MIDYAAILTSKFDGKWILDGDDYSGLSWLSKSPKPSKEELDALWPIVQQEIADKVAAKQAAKLAVLEKLGISETEAKLLFA